MIASNVTFWKFAFRPSFAAIALPRSTSRPMMVLPSVSKYSFGAYDASVAMFRVPADLIAAGTSDAGSAAAAELAAGRRSSLLRARSPKQPPARPPRCSRRRAGQLGLDALRRLLAARCNR